MPDTRAVFTIVAKNYLSHARTLGDSIKKIHPELDFYIFLSDELQGYVDSAKERYPIIEAKGLGIAQFRQMTFYYSLLELACAIKPFCFDYLFRIYQYEKIVYFDPDMHVYNSLGSVYELLDHKLMVLTPHLTDLKLTGEGAMPDDSFLFVGAYNLGFIALRKCEKIIEFIEWWKSRLISKGFADHKDAQHVDQKWIDLVPGLLGDGVAISRNPGHNAAQWNIHERHLTYQNGAYYMNGKPLLFYHHTSFNPHEPARLASRQSKYTLANKPEYKEIVTAYAAELINNGYDECSKYPYAYARFDNGINIFVFQRRFYRMLIRSHQFLSDPFATAPDTYYDVLCQNRLVIANRDQSEYIKADFKTSRIAERYFKRCLICLKKMIGIKYYYLLIRWLQNNTRPEEQIFLIRKGLSNNK